MLTISILNGHHGKIVLWNSTNWKPIKSIISRYNNVNTIVVDIFPDGKNFYIISQKTRELFKDSYSGTKKSRDN